MLHSSLVPPEFRKASSKNNRPACSVARNTCMRNESRRRTFSVVKSIVENDRRLDRDTKRTFYQNAKCIDVLRTF